MVGITVTGGTCSDVFMVFIFRIKGRLIHDNQAISELSVKEFKLLMDECLNSHDHDMSVKRINTGLSTGHEHYKLFT